MRSGKATDGLARRRAAGRLLIWLGVAAWIPYAVLRYGLDAPVEPGLFLTAHLAGVLPGSLLVRWHWLRQRWLSLRPGGVA